MSETDKELIAYKEISESAAKQISESRNFFEKMYKTTLAAILLIAAVVIGVFYWLVGQKYADIETTITQKANEKTIEQIAVLQEQIRNRVEDEFKTDNMKALIRSVAQDQTKSGLTDVINQAVNDQVQYAIQAESPKIQQTVIHETKKAVSQLAPVIDIAVSGKAKEAEDRVKNEIAQWEDIVTAGNLSILARNGSGEDYDRLMALTSKTQNPDIQKIGIMTKYQLSIEMSDSIYSGKKFSEKKSEQELITLLDYTDPMVRKAAIDELVNMQNKSIVPKLLKIAEHDKFIIVRHAAYHGLKILTSQKIEPLQVEQWADWWEKNKSTWPSK